MYIAEPRVLGSIVLAVPDEHGRRFVSAAAGLVGTGAGGWLVADDLHAIVRVDRVGAPGQLVPLLEPEQRRPGKAPRKPDIEALVQLAPTAGRAHGALLALGSGSKGGAARERGALLELDAAGQAVGGAREIAFGKLYADLRTRLGGRVNIEGAAVRQGRDGAELLLASRGTDGPSAIIVLDHDALVAAARSGRALDGSLVRSVHRIDLGSIDGVALTLSDIRALDDGRIVAAASAEAADGSIAGSALGVIDAALGSANMQRLAGPPRKVEAIELAERLPGWSAAPGAAHGGIELIAATDPDDPAAAAELLHVLLPG